ncbi:MAG: hypothetical protein D6776_05500 [Planctomycetota bacterium]|nr:MAG: hypothetical protein D6776_05500 [Planctomycetota bacterium]
MPRPTATEELRWKRALLETIGAALRDGAEGGDPLLFARISHLIHEGPGDEDVLGRPERRLPPAMHLEARIPPLETAAADTPPPFSQALLDSAEIYLADGAYRDALRFARAAVLTAARETDRDERAQQRLQQALDLVARIGHAAGCAGLECPADTGDSEAA